MPQYTQNAKCQVYDVTVEELVRGLRAPGERKPPAGCRVTQSQVLGRAMHPGRPPLTLVARPGRADGLAGRSDVL